MPTAVVVAEDAERWRRQMEAAGWSGDTVAVDVNGEVNELGDVVVDIVRALGERPADVDVAIGVGHGGRAAQLMALGGRSASLVIVDGLAHRFAQPDEVIGARMEWMRRRTDGESPALPRLESRAFAERAASAVGVPTLVIETSASQSPPEVVDTVVNALPNGELLRVESLDEAVVRITAWIGA